MTINTAARTNTRVYLLGTATGAFSTATDSGNPNAIVGGGCTDRTLFTNHSIQVYNPDGATVQIFVSLDGVHFVQYGADIITDGFIVMAYGSYNYIYAVRNATAGNVAVIIESGKFNAQ